MSIHEWKPPKNEKARMANIAGIKEVASHKNKIILDSLVKLIAPQGEVNRGIEEALYELKYAGLKDEAKKVERAQKKAQEQLAIIAKIFGDATSMQDPHKPYKR